MNGNIMTAKEQFGSNLRWYREKLKMTQVCLANRSGFSRAYISAMERGKANPTLETLVILARELEVEACYLLIDTKRIG